MAKVLKVSVLADGSVRLDGAPVSTAELAGAMDAAGEGATVWYHRENAEGEAPPAAMEVMELIASRRLAVRLSTKPDFSDAVGAADAEAARIFAAARARAAEGQIAIVRPDWKVMLLPAPKRETVAAEAIAEVERLLPSDPPRKVAAIVDTSWSMDEKPKLAAAQKAVPFFGMLAGFSMIGHAVWLFDGKAGVQAGCAEADLALIDGPLAGGLAAGWESAAPVVRVFDRETKQLRKV